ncbi:MAG: hypothetical protein HKN21_10650 [Candidatus Eisenbacteria bacterium]|uniref:Right-handed parallel beta-helix repeat-containing protein n=1 Tax=Eiseniibacteriota bacterium TaxID=2212470 RepID=A0A7Y2H306_UNCEI|nr:hypothetical protein [Candidatus Eisenbacteria bacterium]
MQTKLSLAAVLLAMIFTTSMASADEYLIYVARKDTPAYTAAQGKANETTVFAQRTLHKALRQAAELLQTGPHTVTVLVAEGAYVGKAKQGVWVIPVIDNPEATLRLVGGMNEDFSARQPFAWLTRLVTREGRDGALLQITKKSKLKELVVSGFLFDAAPSNAYDSKTNSLLKGQSRTYPLMSLSLIHIDHLVIDSNIFINGAHGAFEPYIVPLSANTVVDITNNCFLNTIIATSTKATSFRGNVVKEINFVRNSFLLNWPYNPDPTSALVSAINLYHKDGCVSLNIEQNLFAFNPGGALQHDWPEDRMPEITLNKNLFFMNAGLFEDGADDGGVIAGKLGLNPKYLIIDLETLEDDFDYTVNGNVVMDPKIPIAMADLQAADSYSVERKNTVLNDVRRLFGLNQDGGTVAIANFAPALVYDPSTPPLPTEEAAKGYGFQPSQLWSP